MADDYYLECQQSGTNHLNKLVLQGEPALPVHSIKDGIPLGASFLSKINTEI